MNGNEEKSGGVPHGPLAPGVPGAISSLSRSQTLDRLERERFDCAVIGGGITGAGIACSAARRGLSVALLEAEDFASGTSSRSSKLIHGGLRYLALGDVKLVRETALERKEIFRAAPHLAERRWMVVPTRSRAGMLKLRVGISTYEKLGAVDEEDMHRNWGPDEIAAEEPLLDRNRHGHACVYREYLTDDARLVVANLRAAAADGACALNHARVERILVEEGSATGLEGVCALTGRHFTVRAGVVVNAAGPWVEQVRSLEDADAAPLLHLSKGIHIVVDAERLPIRNMIVLGARDGRSIFAIRRGPVVYVGTTDTSYERGAEMWPEITLDDVDYLLEAVPRYFSVEPIAPAHVLAAWAGLRPLIAEPGKSASAISRRDEVLTGPAGVITIAGGKLTGYRPMASRVVEQIAGQIGASLADDGHEPPLPGGDFDGELEPLEAHLTGTCGLPAETAWRLVRAYGSEAPAVVACGSDPLLPGASFLLGEIDWAVRVEGAVTVEDVVYRRNRVACYDPAVRNGLVEPIAARMAELLGWGGSFTTEKVRAMHALMESELGFLGSGQ